MSEQQWAGSDGIIATGSVIRGGNREVEITQKVVCPNADGQNRYEVLLTGKLIIPAGDALPIMVTSGWPRVTEAASEHESITVPNQQHLDAIYARRQADADERARKRVAALPPLNIRADVVVRDSEGNIKATRTTDPIPLPGDEPTPSVLVGVNTVVEARPDVAFSEEDND